MKDLLLKKLNEVRPEIDFTKQNKLIDDGILDSFDIISLVNLLNEAFDIEIEMDDLEAENFNSPDAMLKLIERLQSEQ